MTGVRGARPTLEDMAALRGERYLDSVYDAGPRGDRPGGGLYPAAQQIGPTPAEVATPLSPDELPLGRSGAFREYGTFA